ATELLAPTLLHQSTLDEATTVQFPGLDGALPGYGTQAPNDWGLGFEMRNGKSPHWTGLSNSPSTYGHFGAAGTFMWVDPAVSASPVFLPARASGPWASEPCPPRAASVIRVLACFSPVRRSELIGSQSRQIGLAGFDGLDEAVDLRQEMLSEEARGHE